MSDLEQLWMQAGRLRGSQALFRRRDGEIEAWLCEQHAAESWGGMWVDPRRSDSAPGVVCGRCLVSQLTDATPECLERVARLSEGRDLDAFLKAAVSPDNLPEWTQPYQYRHVRFLFVDANRGFRFVLVAENRDRRVDEEFQPRPSEQLRKLSGGESIGLVAITVVTENQPDEMERFELPL